MASQPKLTLHLQADRLCLLNHHSRFSLVIFITLASGQPITLIRTDHDDHAGLKELLESQCIKCTDVESGELIPVLDSRQASQYIDPGAACPPLMTLQANRSTYLTFTTAINPRDGKFVFDPRGLKPDRTYKIQCNTSELQWWTYGSQEPIGEYFKTHRNLSSPETPPLQCEPLSDNNTVTFDTRCELTPAPEVSISLSASPTMSLSSSQKFPFSLAFTFHAQKPITVLAERDSAIAGNTHMEILEGVTRNRLAPDMIDTGNDDGPWLREDFLRLEPGVPHVEHATFEPAYKHSGLEALEVNREYLLRMVDNEGGW